MEKVGFRLAEFKVNRYYADRWEAYAELVPPEVLIQTKVETPNIDAITAGAATGLRVSEEEPAWRHMLWR